MKKLNKIKENNVKSLIARDLNLLSFSGRKTFSWTRKVYHLIQNYADFDNQEKVLGGTRIYRKIAKKAAQLNKQQNEKFFFANFATRDLTEKSEFDLDSDFVIDLNFRTQLELDDAVIEELQHPPPIKNSLIPNINLTARLLPAPTLASA